MINKFNYNILIKNILFIFSPFLLFFDQLYLYYNIKRFKVNLREINLFFISFFILTYIYIYGGDNISKFGISLPVSFYSIITKISLLFYIYNNPDSLKNLLYLIFIWISLSFIYTFYYQNQYVNLRYVFLFLTGSKQNSTNFINILVILTSIMILKKNNYILFFIIIGLLISFIWKNRTGLIFFPTFYITILLIKKKYLFLIPSFFIFLFNYKYIFSLTRFKSEGITSMRWLTQYETFVSWINFKYPYGGYTIILGDTIWAHNIFLDAYRLTGFYLPVALLILYIYSFIKTLLITNNLAIRLLVWTTSLFLSLSSVVFEGTNLELVFITLGIFNFFFIDKN